MLSILECDKNLPLEVIFLSVRYTRNWGSYTCMLEDKCFLSWMLERHASERLVGNFELVAVVGAFPSGVLRERKGALLWV